MLKKYFEFEFEFISSNQFCSNLETQRFHALHALAGSDTASNGGTGCIEQALPFSFLSLFILVAIVGY